MAKVGNNDESTLGGAKGLGGATGAGFMPGKSGNPNGRPKMPEELKMLLRGASPGAIKTLISIAKTGEKESDRIKAAEAILDRAYGKPVQAIDATHDGTVEITTIRRVVVGDAGHPDPRVG